MVVMQVTYYIQSYIDNKTRMTQEQQHNCDGWEFILSIDSNCGFLWQILNVQQLDRPSVVSSLNCSCGRMERPAAALCW